MKYNPQKIEKKWQNYWQIKKLYQAKDSAKGKKNSMLLVEFPYPSGNLHIGHWYAFAVPDILSRYLKMKGLNVMYPIGFDAFGLPAENAAIQRKINPRDWTEKNIKYMTKQLKSMGAAFDWSRVVSTIDPDYYKWTQWIFLKMYGKGLAYRKKTFVNWCPTDKTVLANEQVINGKCERCDSEVVQEEIEQWMFKITDYADRLIDDLENLDWPETTKLAQKNWIGRSEGTLIRFQVSSFKFQDYIEVFTTRVDTIYGCTYVVVAPEHPLLENKELRIKNYEEVKKYINQAKRKSNLQRVELDKQKTGVELKGIKAINPFTNEKIPVFVADYVLGSYGTGVVMAVPAHDERDWEFATKYNLPIKEVVRPILRTSDVLNIGKSNSGTSEDQKLEKAFTEDGILVNSGPYSKMTSQEAREKMAKWLEKNNFGKKTKIYRLHDWVLSRQRYWGVPIPVIYCRKCWEVKSQKAKVKSNEFIFINNKEHLIIPVIEKDLPVKLPPLKDFMPTSDGRSPLAKAKNWVKVKCPKCKGMAERETDTMDTFVDSSWYFIRYADQKNKKKFADPKKMKKWLPVPLYIGGAEHNTMHLLYSRFFTKVLYDLKLIDFNEPFVSRRNHGVILGSDNQKMSKSRGNVVDPDKEVAKFGADSVRMYLAFMGPYDQGGPWQLNGIVGIKRFLERVGDYFNRYKIEFEKNPMATFGGQRFIPLLNRTIKKVQEDIESLHFNTAISQLMILFNELRINSENKQGRETGAIYKFFDAIDMKKLLILLSPFAPHLSEELWQQLRGTARTKHGQLRKFASIHQEKWPKYDEKLIVEEEFELIIQVNGKLRDLIKAKKGLSENACKNLALNSPKIKKAIADKKIKRIIFVPDKLINFVV